MLPYIPGLLRRPGRAVPRRPLAHTIAFECTLPACFFPFSLADGWATVTPRAEGVPAPSQFGASLTGRVTVAIMEQGLAHTHQAL
eukprot:2035285-Pyramimonas_sp.AAC.1